MSASPRLTWVAASSGASRSARRKSSIACGVAPVAAASWPRARARSAACVLSSGVVCSNPGIASAVIAVATARTAAAITFDAGTAPLPGTFISAVTKTSRETSVSADPAVMWNVTWPGAFACGAV
jgi:hypothetical protein